MPSENRTFIEEARRAQIIECAIQTIASRGYSQASLSKIAKLAKISTGVISYHFGSKDELIKAVVAHVAKLAVDMMVPQITAQPTASEALRVYLTTNLEFMRLHPQPVLALVEILSHGHAEDGGPNPYAEQNGTALTDLEQVLAWGQETGEFRDFDLRTMAIAIRGAMDATPAEIIRNRDFDLQRHASELATLFALATGKTP
ncbi:TetR family transcriptional regulator [Actinomadura cremea]|nr:TetR family transcriptional regulator [Actinomadura cremea]